MGNHWELTVGYMLGAIVGSRDGETVGVKVEGFRVGVDEGNEVEDEKVGAEGLVVQRKLL
jgi:hypothetical protein